jgi:flagellar export protein FliJ
MSGAKQTTQALSRLVELRERELERLSTDMASRQAVRTRYQENLARLDRLHQDLGPTGRLSPALSLNCGAYKQAVMHLAASHREDLALHEADMDVARQALAAAARQREVLGQVLERRERAARHQQQARERKHQDEIATQVWQRDRGHRA